MSFSAPLLALLVAAPEAGLAPHLGVSTGVGTGYDVAGLRLELRVSHFSAFAGLGTGLVSYLEDYFRPSPGLRLCAGVQYLSRDGAGLQLALQTAIGAPKERLNAPVTCVLLSEERSPVLKFGERL